MAEGDSVRTDRTRYLDSNKEPDMILPPLPTTSQTTQILSLRESAKSIQHLVNDLEKCVSNSLTKCKRPQDGLTQDESAALYLYSLQWPEDQPSLYAIFNRALRNEDRTKLVPFHNYYNLFMSALNKLPAIRDSVWRGVNGDISKQYLKGTIHIWWGATSCTHEVMVTDTFLDKKTPRTLFNIKCYNGKSIQNHSKFPKESETILAPGTYIKVTSQSNPAENLHIVQCEQIEPTSEEEIVNSLAVAVAAATLSTPGILPTMKSVLYLIWLDPNVHKSSDNLKTQEKLRELFGDDFQTHEKLDECESSIRQKSNDSIIFIVGGQIGQQIVSKIHDVAQLMTLLVYCMDKERNEKWTKNYAKVKAVVVRSTELLKEVEKEKNKFVTAAAATKHQAESKSALMTPISGYEDKPLVSLEDAIEPLHDIIPDMKRYVLVAKQRAVDPQDGLTQDESASIILYTMEWRPPELCLYNILNRTLRSEDRNQIKPFFCYLKLSLTALQKLPSFQGIVWRGVRLDLSGQFRQGHRGVWWSFSTTTLDAGIFENNTFFGNTGARTLFSIECKNAKQIRNHSMFPREEEVLLMPSFYYEVISVLKTSKDMHLVNLKEIDVSY